MRYVKLAAIIVATRIRLFRLLSGLANVKGRIAVW